METILLGYLAAMSLFALILYGIDKSRAVRKRWRIREAWLLGVSFLGGSVGALLGMQLFRHKTRHWYFYAVALLGLAWQIALLVLLHEK